MSAIDKFQNDAKHIASTLNVSGRFSFQEEAMKLVVGDIVQKLKIKPRLSKKTSRQPLMIKTRTRR